MAGLIGKKVGMTSMFNEAGKNQACTVIEAGPCVVTQLKTEEVDGYSAIQLAYDDKKEKNTSAPLQGHFSKAKNRRSRSDNETLTFGKPQIPQKTRFKKLVLSKKTHIKDS